jgi:ribonuclease-3
VTSRQVLLDALRVDLPDELLSLALTHRSYAYEHGGLPTNERLEFLGDAVLGLTITDELYHRHPDRSEGDLAKLRASVVNTQALADVARNRSEEGLGVYL